MLVSTFSIAALDLETGDLGVAVQSKFPNVRPIVPWAAAEVGAVATQAAANVSYGPRGLALLANGASAEAALRALIADDDARETRQVGIVDANGGAATWTGAECFAWAGGRAGEAEGRPGQVAAGAGFAAQGNILRGPETVAALAQTFHAAPGGLADRLVAALVAGGQAGGDRRGEQSAALLVKRAGAGYDGTSDDFVDISLYDHPRPLAELERLLALHKLHFFRSDPADLIPIDEPLCRELQALLGDAEYRGFGFYTGPAHGRFDAATQKALQDFMGWENYDVRIRADNLIDRVVLADMRAKYAAWRERRGAEHPGRGSF
jgi:uncharacterized Ntn-hydrolase superfamily protein